jgi:hypothetical protein
MAIGVVAKRRRPLTGWANRGSTVALQSRRRYSTVNTPTENHSKP